MRMFTLAHSVFVGKQMENSMNHDEQNYQNQPPSIAGNEANGHDKESPDPKEGESDQETQAARKARWQKEIDILIRANEQRYLENLPPRAHPTFREVMRLVKCGFSIFPARIRNGAKKSYIAGSRNGGARWGATNCLETLFEYWREFPDALIGIVTGSKAEGGADFFVVDIDTLEGHGVDGVGNSRMKLESVGKTFDDLPQTVMACTPTGGWHLYFKFPEGLGPRKFLRHLAPGVDIQANKQSIMAPPSYRADKGAPYTWYQSPFDHPMAEAPDWLIELVSEPMEGAKATASLIGSNGNSSAGMRRKSTRQNGGGDGKAVLAAMLGELRKAQEGARNDTLNKCAYKLGSYVAAGLLDEGTVVDELTIAATEIGLGIAEIAGTIASGLSAGVKRADLTDGGNHTGILDDFDHSDTALAKELHRDHFRGYARYCKAESAWYVCDGTLWRKDDLNEVITQTIDFHEAKANGLLRAAHADVSDPGVAASRTKRAKELGTKLKDRHKINAVEEVARAIAGVPVRPEDFDVGRLRLGTPGGVVDLSTGELKPGRREDLITKSTAVTPSEPGRAPHRFLKFLNEIFGGDQELIESIRRLGGYALTGSTDEHSLFFFYGGGSNGKSVLLNILRWIWGDYAKEAPKELFFATRNPQHPTALAGMRAARLAIGSEIPREATWNDAMIKDLTGGDRLTARFMRGDYFSFDPQFTLIIAGNTRPALAAVDPAMRRRIKLFPFEVEIPAEQRDPDLLVKLKLEAPEILRWFIEGAVFWQKDGLKLPARITQASEGYLDAEDHVKRFLEEMTTRVHKGNVKVADLHAAYSSWCLAQNISVPRRCDFISDLENHRLVQSRNGAGMIFSGLKLNTH